MATFIVPFKPRGKTRLGDAELARAMLNDVLEACSVVGDAVIADGLGGQGKAVAATLAKLTGPVTIVNSDLPCVSPAELEELRRAAPALVAAADGTTNALALRDAGDFVPLYGAGSAARFELALGARRLDLPGLRDDVDTWDDFSRVRDRVGPRTRALTRVPA